MSYFTDDEFRCSCCGRSEMNSNFIGLLNQIREDFGRPMVISSGYRCENHPAERNKANGPGSHNTGWAADVAVQGADAQRLIECALRNGITGLGVNQKGSVGRFIHLDQVPAVGTHKPFTRPTVWSY